MSQKVQTIRATKTIDAKERFAAYCRVSTSKESQLESLEAQVQHYRDYFANSSDQKLVGIYHDQGITGTKKEIRPGLMQLIMDCKDGKIDTVITKSISRLSRNTTDCIEIVRTLLDADVGIIFEKENINTKSMEGEMMLSIMSSMAEEESRSTSNNVKWGVKKRFQEGTYRLSNAPYGYNLVDGNLKINEKEAEAVKLMFDLALKDNGMTAIANELNKTSYKPKKSATWNRGSIFGIINNEAYTGDIRYQKTYTDETFTRHINYGNEDQYLIRNHHPAIISRATFMKVHDLKAKRKEKFNIKADQSQNRNTFTGKLICGECGTAFKKSRELRRGCKDEYINTWVCQLHRRDRTQCSMVAIREMDVEYAFLVMINKLVQFRNILIRPLYDAVTKKESISMQVTYIKGQISKEFKAYDESFDKSTINFEQKQAIIDLWSYVSQHRKPKVFKPSQFERFVDHVVVKSTHELEFHLKCGLKLKEVID
ncbi:recombinase family protein [Sharpea azabuensis]|uniref:recombinase family protein n=1 Tax=Sharpea azabuensis TaxID=322505 RepID=UPI0015699A78|nr:recombinase family protein [Sharpea azabuensis]